MKKAVMVAAVCLMLCAVAACGQTTEKSGNPDNKGQKPEQKSEQEQKPEQKSEQERKLEQEAEPEQTETGETLPVEPEKKAVVVYYGNEDASGFETEEVAMTEITPAVLLQQLAVKKVLPAEVSALSCKTVAKDGVQALELDLSKEFDAYLNTQGTSGEYIVMGCTVNTFLGAYDCEKIQITIEGETLSSGHAEYPGYMSAFK